MFMSFLLIFILTFSASTVPAYGFKSVFPMNNEERYKQSEAAMSSSHSRLEEQKRSQRQITCFPPISCNANAPYRSIDGTCNNIRNPYWGASGIPYVRYLPSQYEDGISVPRGAGRNPSLPTPREISVAISSIVLTKGDDQTSLMCMDFGQFLDHDFSFTPETADARCCSDFRTGTITSASCLPLEVKTNDPFYGPKGVKCLPFVRSAPSSCAPGFEREQINGLTAYIDASMVYGSTAAELAAVRESNSYRLKFGPDREDLSCSATNTHYRCRSHLPVRRNAATGNDEFFAGDRRVEEQPGLTSLHAIFLRMHNDFAEVIRTRNPSFTTEVVFQETRKLVIGILQNIVYGEFLPTVLGPNVMKIYNIALEDYTSSNYTFFKAYDETVDATSGNVFPTAGFRYGHSMVQDILKPFPGNINVELSKSFNNHGRTLGTTFPSSFITGSVNSSSSEMDHVIDSSVRNFLFAVSPFTFGSDLYARNIMRGRDHGLRSYPSWINQCFSGLVNSFSDLTQKKIMPPEVVSKLSELYGGDINQVDLYPAGIAEIGYLGSLLGRTFSCIVGEFFKRAKFGDRYWFEKNNVFKWYQLLSVRSTKLSTLFCIYTNATEMQDNVFKKPSSSTNPKRPCSEILKKGVPNDITLYW